MSDEIKNQNIEQDKPPEVNVEVQQGTPVALVKKPEYGFSDGGFVFSMVIVAYIAVSLIYSVILTVLAERLKTTVEALSDDIIITLSMTAVIELVMLFIWFLYSRGHRIDYLKASKVNKDIDVFKAVKTVVVILALFGFALLLEMAFSWIFDKIGYEPADIGVDKQWQLVIFIPVLTVFPAICEEFIFRGVILSSLEKAGKWKAILISAALFSIFHMNLAQTVYQFILGVVLGYLVLEFRTIWVAAIGHFLSNLLAVAVGIIPGYTGYIIFGAVAGCCLVAIAAYMYINYKKTGKHIFSKPDKIDATVDPAGETGETAAENTGGDTEPAASSESVSAQDKAKNRKLIILSYCAGIGICIIVWIVDLITKLS